MPATLDIGPDDLLLNSPEQPWEFFDGQVKEVEVGAQSQFVTGVIFQILFDYVWTKRLGFVFNSNTPYRCFPHDPRMVRLPDCSFIADGRLKGNEIPKGYIPIAPDLAIEIVSPHDEIEALERKINDYFLAGVKLVWIVYPETRHVLIRRLDQTAQFVPPEGTITGESVVPGFSTPIAAFFISL